MKGRSFADIPLLIFNTGEEDRKAYDAILDSGIPCRLIGTGSEEHTPMLIWSHQKFIGFHEIERFLQKRKGDK